MAPDLSRDQLGSLWSTSEQGGTIRLGLPDGVLEKDAFITGIELPEEGAQLEVGDVLCTLEIKTKVCDGNSCTYRASDVKIRVSTPVIIESVNFMLEDDPLLLQADPRGAGWIAVARANDSLS